MVLIDLKALYGEIAKLTLLLEYLDKALQLAGEGEEVVLTGAAPVWIWRRKTCRWTFFQGRSCQATSRDAPCVLARRL